MIKGFYNVYNNLGYGFLEKVYLKALIMELGLLGLNITCSKPIDVYYKDALLGKYSPDIVVNEIVIVEIKSANALISEHEAQLLNYLKASEMEVGYCRIFVRNQNLSERYFQRCWLKANIIIQPVR